MTKRLAILSAALALVATGALHANSSSLNGLVAAAAASNTATQPGMGPEDLTPQGAAAAGEMNPAAAAVNSGAAGENSVSATGDLAPAAAKSGAAAAGKGGMMGGSNAATGKQKPGAS